jgi:hypothetical protein
MGDQYYPRFERKNSKTCYSPFNILVLGSKFPIQTCMDDLDFYKWSSHCTLYTYIYTKYRQFVETVFPTVPVQYMYISPVTTV